jgi:hypothetical protein
MILKFYPQPDSPHSQIFRKVGQKKAEPNMPLFFFARVQYPGVGGIVTLATST